MKSFKPLAVPKVTPIPSSPRTSQQPKRLSFRSRLSTLILPKDKATDPELVRQRAEYQAWLRLQPARNREPNLSFACDRGYVLLIHDLIKSHGVGRWMDERSSTANLRTKPPSPVMERHSTRRWDDIRSPLQIAASREHYECLDVLLSHADGVQFSSIISAVRDAGDRDDLDMLRFLLDARPTKDNYQMRVNQSNTQRTVCGAIQRKRYEIALELLRFEFELGKGASGVDTRVVKPDKYLQAALIAVLNDRKDDVHMCMEIANYLIMQGALQWSPHETISRFCISNDIVALQYLLRHPTWEMLGSKKEWAVQKAFHQAVKEHQISQDAVDLLLVHGLDVNERDWQGHTILHRAVVQYEQLSLEKLLDHGGRTDNTNNRGQTVVDMVLTHEKARALQILVNRDPSVLQVRSPSKNQNYLMQASNQGWAEGVEILLRAGAVTDATDFEKNTALHLAAADGHSEVVQLLLEAGADAAIPNATDFFPIHVAVMAGSWECYCDFLEFDTSYVQGEYHKGLFALAVGPPERDQTDILNDVLRRFPINVDSVRDPESDAPPLFWAARDGKSDVVRTLLANGADPNCKTKTPSIVVLALTEHHDSVARQLLEGGADVQWTTSGRTTFNLLHIACKEGGYETAATLLRKGISPNAMSPDGFLPLHLVVQRDDARMARLLLSHGANADLSRDLPSPRALAQRCNSRKILNLFG